MVLSQEISQNVSLEISLWLRKEKNKILNLKCKEWIKFEGEINSMSTYNKTWIKGYSEWRLVSTKDHYNSKPHMKALWSFISSILKMPAEVGQKDVGVSVSLEKVKRKANIAYFAAKNTSFRKFPNLVDLVTREGNMNFEKDIGSLYVNKNCSLKLISAHGESSVKNVAGVVSKLTFFSILMDGWTIHGKEKEGGYI